MKYSSSRKCHQLLCRLLAKLIQPIEAAHSFAGAAPPKPESSEGTSAIWRQGTSGTSLRIFKSSSLYKTGQLGYKTL